MVSMSKIDGSSWSLPTVTSKPDQTVCINLMSVFILASIKCLSSAPRILSCSVIDF